MTKKASTKKTKKALKFQPGQKVWLVCADTDFGEKPAIDPFSLEFMEAVVKEHSVEEEQDGYWLDITDDVNPGGTPSVYEGWYETRFILDEASYNKIKTWK